MSQVFQVMKCYQCETYQVQQVKCIPTFSYSANIVLIKITNCNFKTIAANKDYCVHILFLNLNERKKRNKWQCKMCNVKQSVVKVFGEGAAADCRRHVQKLNMMRMEENRISFFYVVSPTPTPTVANQADVYREDESEKPATTYDKRKLFSADEEGRQSKWTAFLEPEEELGEEKEAEDEETYTTSRTEFQQAYRRMKQDKRGAKKARLSGSLSTSDHFPSCTLSIQRPQSEQPSPKHSFTHSLRHTFDVNTGAEKHTSNEKETTRFDNLLVEDYPIVEKESIFCNPNTAKNSKALKDNISTSVGLSTSSSKWDIFLSVPSPENSHSQD